jgi:hypothetical protein
VSFHDFGLYGLSWSFLQNQGFIEAEPSGFVTSNAGVFKVGPLPAGNYTLSLKSGSSSWTGQGKVVEGATEKVKAVF